MWVATLEENGIAVLPIDSEHVRLTHDDDSAVFFVLTIPRVARTHDIKPAPERHALLVPRSITSAALERAWAAGWSVVTDDGAGQLRFAQRTLRLNSADATQTPRRPRGRPGRTVFSVVRALFALDQGARQDEIAEFAHVGQAAVSKALNRLVNLNLVARGEHGWQVTDRAGALSWWLAHYPGPGGLETHWFGVDPINEQAYRAYRALDTERANPVLSGDVAADLVAAWRTPRQATLYAQRGTDLSVIGLTPSDASASTMTLVLPDDPGIWPISKAPVLLEMRGHGDIARANAFQVLYDLSRSPGPDADEALDAWRTWMIESDAVL
ncbi:MarR family transcriptional regulator [uncultured Jatrophihabitans sp.]|uniref:MarR family transcriptional regulator n=1 Tax=uncultured Jatrophihabitans sp. TaxID=1610747 RepID=UPI0035CB9B4A